ncbi:MAG: VWA domain-containing protein, partial [Anaerolineales bacterium]
MTGHLLHNLLQFGRLLRGLGMDVNPGRMVDLIHALEHIQIGRKSDFYFATRSLLVNRRDDLPLFDQAFDLFWRKPRGDGTLLELSHLNRARPRDQPTFATPALDTNSAQSDAGGREEPDPDEPPIVEVTLTYSIRERLANKDFAELSGDEIQSIKRLMDALVWRLGERRTRRRRPGRGELPDLRRTVRRNLRYGGEILSWAYREPKFKPRPLVVVADISGSMERYTRLLLRFIYSLAEGLTQSVEAFVFSTRLTRITRQLHGRDVDRVLQEVSQVVPDWSGGTRIGSALKTFNYDWGRRVLGRGAVVLLISDGWDRGEPDTLRRE